MMVAPELVRGTAVPVESDPAGFAIPIAMLPAVEVRVTLTVAITPLAMAV